jgi:hypothetical protein
MLVKYDPEVNPLGSVIAYADRIQAFATAFHAMNQRVKDFTTSERHLDIWTDGMISGTRRSFLESRLEVYLKPLDGVEILRLSSAFLILLDCKVVMHIKIDNGSLRCSPPPKLLRKLDLILRHAKQPRTPPLPGLEDYVKVEPSLKDVADFDVRLRDVKVIVGLYRPDTNYILSKFTIGIQSGKELKSPYEIDLTKPNLTAINFVKKTRKTSTKFGSDNADKASGN